MEKIQIYVTETEKKLLEKIAKHEYSKISQIVKKIIFTSEIAKKYEKI